MAQSLTRDAPRAAGIPDRRVLRLDQSAETAALCAVQRRLGQPPVLGAARALSLFGEHAAGWLALGLLGAAADRRRRREWLIATAAVAGAHGAAIAVKRVVRRARPDHPDVAVHVGTPSRLSFPSSHATSTTAAAVLFGTLLNSRSAAAVVPAMLVSRLVLGVHYPSDVLAGSALGALIGTVTRRRIAARRRDTNLRRDTTQRPIVAGTR